MKGNRDGAQQAGHLQMRGLNIVFRSNLRPLGVIFAASLVWILAVAVAAQESASNKGANQEPITPLENPPALDPSKVALGESLFKDPILSGKNNLACSSCHDLNTGGAIDVQRTVGHDGQMHRFNTPTIFNAANNYRLGWLGRFTTLEAQNEAGLLDPNLMASNWDDLISKLNASKNYNAQFEKVYGHEARRVDVLDALATFQRSLVTPDSRFDRYLRGNAAALSPEELRGYELFKSYGCTSCHQGTNVGGNLFEKFGIFDAPPSPAGTTDESDLGRWTVTHAEQDKGVFRVPSLRNVAVTAPYFHDGRTASLPEAVAIMARVQLGHAASNDDISAFVAFLKTLTGEYKGRPLDASAPSAAQ